MGRMERDDEEDELPDRERPRSTAELGADAEALVAGFRSTVDGHDIVTQHAPGEPPQGVDIESIDSSLHMHITEVKGTDAERYRKPRMSENVSSRQMSDDWVVARSGVNAQIEIPGASAVGDAPDQVHKSVFQVDERGGTLTEWAVDEDGKVSSAPERIYDLHEIHRLLEDE